MREIRPGWIAAAVVGLVALLFVFGKASDALRAKAVALWVAIEPEGSTSAFVGPVAVPVGSAFRLHAVVEAESFGGERIYYTEATDLEFFGAAVARDSLRRWSRSPEPRILWFTVDGAPYFRELASGQELEAPSYTETFRSDWGNAWAVTGDLRPGVENYLPNLDQADREPRFGTQRFHVRMEFFANRGDLVPELRLRSWGAGQLPERSDEFPTVVASLAGSLAEPSRVFGLPQIEAPGQAQTADGQARLADWTRRLVAFSRISVLAAWLRERNTAWDALSWTAVEVGRSETPARPGDLLRVGNRIVWILKDQGELGKLDREDLCLDFDRGARVLPLDSVFTGEGLVEWGAAPAVARSTAATVP